MSAPDNAAPRKILIAEDDPVSRLVLCRLLKQWGYEPVETQNGAEAWKLLETEDGPRIAILDWMMPEIDGLDVCRKVRERGRGSYVYIILLTGRGNKPDVVRGLESGADDYLIKPFDATELRARLTVGNRILTLQDDLLASQERLRFEAAHDPLTGLWNRRAILMTLERELARAGRSADSLAVVMSDLDFFKCINDTRGHAAGDAVLCEVARRMVATTRIYDAVGRYGGEEFLILLPGCDAADALKLAERLRVAIAGKPVHVSEGEIGVTLSSGVAVFVGAHPSEAATLLRAADVALYRAKSNGRNRVEFAGPGTALAPSVAEPFSRSAPAFIARGAEHEPKSSRRR